MKTRGQKLILISFILAIIAAVAAFAYLQSLKSSSENYESYTVEPGETLKSISRKVYENEDKYTAIKEANNIQDENLILTGETIKISILGQ